jgi:glycoside/pentoside/hexuronide:cation symporter, GPH family
MHYRLLWTPSKVSVPPTEKLPLGVKLGNGFGSVAYGIKDNGFATLLLLFYNQVMGLDAGKVGLILLCALLLDAVVDPMVGFWSDKTHSRWGKRHPWLYASILPMALSWIMLWHPPLMSKDMLYLYLLLFAFLMRAAVSCYEVPALSIVPALTADYDERTSITRWRYLFGWAGGLLMLTLAFGVFLVPGPGYPVGQLNVHGYELYGWTGGALMIIATSLSALSTHRRIARLPDTAPTHLPLGDTLRQIVKTLSNRSYLILMLSSVFAFINQGVTFSSTTYTMTYYWEMPQAGFLAYSLTLFIGVIGAFLLVGAMQSRMEKKTGAVGAGTIALFFAVTPYLLRMFDVFPQNDSPWLIPLLFTLITVSNALAVASMMLGQSMAADVVEASQQETGERSEGLFFAGYFFVQKCATGLGIFITGTIVSLSGFPAQARPGQVAQPVLDSLALYLIGVVVICGVASITAISRFNISRADHEARLQTLAAQNAL